MEVHHHAHSSPTHSGALRKRWTHYFWEFLMLFFAVFCGFLAENLREHYIEHMREKKYARTLYQDLKVDTATLNKTINTNIYVTARIDTFRSMVQNNEINAFPSGTWYYYARFGTRYFHIPFQDATIDQLKSSGGLRYFRKDKIVNSIARYDQSCRDLLTLLRFQDPIYSDIIIARNVILNANYLDEIMDFDISPINIDSFKMKQIPLLSTNKSDFIQYSNLCQLRSYNNKYMLRSIQVVLKNAESLLSELKKEYDLSE
jgi:hypothetical protein